MMTVLDLDNLLQWIGSRDAALAAQLRHLDRLLDSAEYSKLEKQRERLATALNVIDEFEASQG